MYAPYHTGFVQNHPNVNPPIWWSESTTAERVGRFTMRIIAMVTFFALLAGATTGLYYYFSACPINAFDTPCVIGLTLALIIGGSQLINLCCGNDPSRTGGLGYVYLRRF